MNSATPKEARRAVAQLTVLRILVYATAVPTASSRPASR